MIPEGTTLFPETWNGYQMYYDDEPYAYWADDIAQWVLYKEYDNYRSICHPNDCLCAIGSDELPEGFKQKSLFNLPEDSRLAQQKGWNMKVLDIVHVTGRGYIFIGEPENVVHVGDKVRFNGHEFEIFGVEKLTSIKEIGLIIGHSEFANTIFHVGDEVEIISKK